MSKQRIPTYKRKEAIDIDGFVIAGSRDNKFIVFQTTD